MNRPKHRSFPARFFWFLGLLPACASFSPVARHTDPLTTEQHQQLGATYEAQGLADLARLQYDAALRQDTRSIPALIARGNLAFAGGDLKGAEADYRRVLKINHKHAGANNNLAMVYLQRGGELKRAQRLAETAVAQEGAVRPYAMETLASIHARQGRSAEAARLLDEAESLTGPGDAALREQIDRTRQTLPAVGPTQ